MRAYWFIFAFLSSALLTSCYNKEFNEPGRIDIDRKPTEVRIPVNFSRAWAATQRVFTKFPIEEKRSDKNSGRAYLVTRWISGKSDVLYSGYDNNRMPYTIRYKLYVYLTAANGSRGAEVRIKNVEQYREDAVTAGVDFDKSLFSWIRTESSTLKEARLLKEINKLARDPKFNP